MKVCPECDRSNGEHEEWCSFGGCWLPDWLKRWLWLLAALVFLFVPSAIPDENSLQVYLFDKWMTQLCEIAPRYHFKIKDCEDESLREWFWLYFFLDGKTPKQAIIETTAWDNMTGQTHG